MNGLLVQIKVLLQGLVNRIIGELRQDAGQSLFIDRRVVQGIDVIVLNVAQFNNGTLERDCSLFVRIGNGVAVSAVDLSSDVVFINIINM